MAERISVILAVGALVLSMAGAQAQNPPGKPAPAVGPSPVDQLAGEMAKRLGEELHVRTVVGGPMKAGSVTLIPIIMIDIGFGGGQAGMPQGGTNGSGYFMSGQARPLGFVAVSKKGTRFISVGKTPGK
ncbi:MAG TPA: hypothetical protein VMS75_09250 [Terriglobales bacterium]|nr:hypothetical protein [Terriglobales bacterium]